MRSIVIVFCLFYCLSLSACGKPDSSPPKLIEPQRQALDKARGVEETLQKDSEETRKKIDEAEGK